MVIAAILIVGAVAWWMVQSSNKKTELTGHKPISINGDGEFTKANGVVAGRGTASDPYIIADWDIDALTANGIWIQNTDAHFTVKNCSVHNGQESGASGISLYRCFNGSFENNNCSNNSVGILFDSSSNNTLVDNTCSSNEHYGIDLESSNDNTLSNNKCNSNKLHGVEIGSSTRNALNNNSCSSNRVYGVHLEGASNTSLNGNDCSSNGGGIDLDSSSYNTLKANICSNDSVGIVLSQNSLYASTTHNTLTRNSCHWNSGAGIELDSASQNALDDNNCTNNYNGITLAGSVNNELSSNSCNLNEGNGIHLDNSGNNRLSNNKCSFNIHCGISLLGGPSTSGNVILGNQLHDNTQYGVIIDWSFMGSLPSLNMISNNAFDGNNGANGIFNELHVQACDNGMNNSWNSTDGFGNYWGDWTTPDTNHDGIVDAPYIIDGYGFSSAKDYYPLAAH